MVLVDAKTFPLGNLDSLTQFYPARKPRSSFVKAILQAGTNWDIDRDASPMLYYAQVPCRLPASVPKGEIS